jgi:hypothetical protein
MSEDLELDLTVRRHLAITTERKTLAEAMAFVLGAVEQEMIEHPVIEIHSTRADACTCGGDHEVPEGFFVRITGFGATS